MLVNLLILSKRKFSNKLQIQLRLKRCSKRRLMMEIIKYWMVKLLLIKNEIKLIILEIKNIKMK